MGLVLGIILMCSSCQQSGGNSTGSEYMPDMAHSVAYEANYYNYYYNNTWGSEKEYHKFAQPGLPVAGSVPRTNAGAKNLDMSVKGLASHAGIAITANGSVPYYYKDTDEDRERAIAEIIDNPYPITEDGLKIGKDLYDIQCGICHGDKADGNGFLVRDANPAKGDPGGVYPVQPAILTNPEFMTASNGRYYHAIMHGKNLMGGYADKLSYEERWQVIHYIRSLQAKSNGTEYNQFTNTFNTVDRPAGEIASTSTDVYSTGESFDYDRSMMHQLHGDGHHGKDHHGGHGDHHRDDVDERHDKEENTHDHGNSDDHGSHTDKDHKKH